MAQTAVTVARRHGEKSFEVLIDPSVHPNEHVQEFRKIAGDREHPEFAEVQLWTSGEGVTKSKRFREPELLESKEDTQPEKTAPEAPAAACQIAQVDAPANTTTGEAKAKPKAK